MRSLHVREMEVWLELKYVMNRAQESADYLQYIISLYNREDEGLEDVECLYLEKYLPRRGEYCVVLIDGKERIVSKEETQKNNYQELEYGAKEKAKVPTQVSIPMRPQKLSREELENFINNNLISIGFERVYDTERETILFNKDRNIVFYVDDKDKFVNGYYVYQQPGVFKSGVFWMTRFNNVNNCSKNLIPFPKFNIADYPNLSSPFSAEFEQYEEYFHDAPFTCFYLSMKKIAQIPSLMEAIGEKNREIVYKTLNSYNDNKGNKCLKK